MKSIFSITSLIALATCSPIPEPSGTPLPLVSISLIGSPSHYFISSSQQASSTTSSNAWSIHIPLDVPIDLSTRPEHVQAIEISSVEAGIDIEGAEVGRDDVAVRCKAALEWGSEGVVFDMGERAVLDGGKMVRVTGVSCWKEGLWIEGVRRSTWVE
jgi:hypothetical protein